MAPQHLAVSDKEILSTPHRLKQAALLCDQVVVIGLGTALWNAERTVTDRPLVSVAEVEWLREQGVVTDPPPEFSDVVRASLEVAADRALGRNEDAAALDLPSERDDLEAGLLRLIDQYEQVQPADVGLLWPRIFAAELRRRYGKDAVSIGTPRLLRQRQLGMTRDTVTHLVMESLPQPSETTPWEVILEFRSDPATGQLLRRLRRWMSAFSVTHASLSHSETVDELRYLLDEYEAYMRIHRMKFVHGILETLLVTSAEVLESMLKVRWGSAAKSLFALKSQKVKLLEAERAAPGRDLAYILRAHERFR